MGKKCIVYGFAGQLKNRLHLSTNGDLHPDTAAYLAKLKKAGCVKNAYVIGGVSVVPDNHIADIAKNSI